MLMVSMLSRRAHCEQEIRFPSCWNGVDLYKTDQSHMSYPIGGEAGRTFFFSLLSLTTAGRGRAGRWLVRAKLTGLHKIACPDSHPKRIITLFCRWTPEFSPVAAELTHMSTHRRDYVVDRSARKGGLL